MRNEILDAIQAQIHSNSVVLVGYGLEGRETEVFLKHLFPDLRLQILDEATDSTAFSRLDQLDEQATVIVSPGIPPKKLPPDLNYTTATNLFFTALPARLRDRTIGVTASKGKSTTASLITAVLQQAGFKVELCGNIGTPMLKLLGELAEGKTAPDWIVLELSSYQLKDVLSAPHLAVFSTFFPEHLDYHGSLDRYFLAKAQITLRQHPDDLFVYPPDDPRIERLAEITKAQGVPVPSILPFSLDQTRLLGEHNRFNMRVAFAVVDALGLDHSKIKKAFEQFEPLPHRLQIGQKILDRWWVDDAISTTPQSTLEGLRALEDRFGKGSLGAVFLGGTDRGYEFSELASYLLQVGVSSLVIFPESGDRIQQVIEQQAIEFGFSPPTFFRTTQMRDAVRWAHQHTNPDQLVVLSTASPSYSLWKNFEEKGDQFLLEVQKMNSDLSGSLI